MPTDDSSLVGGTWCQYPSGNLWYNFIGGEIISALALLLQNSEIKIVWENDPTYEIGDFIYEFL